MLKYLFITTFLVAFVLQGVRFQELSLADMSVWAHQAEYVQTGNPLEFNTDLAYGHPGGPLILGVASIHDIFGISYDTAMLLFLTLFDSLIIGSICVLCYLLRKDLVWTWTVCGILSLDMLYEYATPPSAVAALLVVLLCLLTLYMYEKKDSLKPKLIFLWACIAGVTIATRVDIGILTTFSFLILLKQKIRWSQLFAVIGEMFVAFCIFDPFMWFMPVRHIRDLISKMFYQYANFVPSHLSFVTVLSMSSLLIISIVLACVFLYKKNISSPLPAPFVWILIATTCVVYAVFLSAHFQAVRYFMPIIFIWEIFLPLFLFSLISDIQFDRVTSVIGQERMRFILKISTSIILVGYGAVFLFNDLWLNYIFHLLPWQH